VPLGLAAGRVGNFINGEFWGRVIADPSLPWAMIFPQSGDMQPRHPSQLYHVGLEGLALFAILWLYTAVVRPRGAASGIFLIGYGAFRFITEFFREPDARHFRPVLQHQHGAMAIVADDPDRHSLINGLSQARLTGRTALCEDL
jgi:phosphatidylglycerol:prolipoprotein diacylglycerol transferase